jgi:hypothetical protein
MPSGELNRRERISPSNRDLTPDGRDIATVTFHAQHTWTVFCPTTITVQTRTKFRASEGIDIHYTITRRAPASSALRSEESTATYTYDYGSDRASLLGQRETSEPRRSERRIAIQISMGILQTGRNRARGRRSAEAPLTTIRGADFPFETGAKEKDAESLRIRHTRFHETSVVKGIEGTHGKRNQYVSRLKISRLKASSPRWHLQTYDYDCRATVKMTRRLRRGYKSISTATRKSNRAANVREYNRVTTPQSTDANHHESPANRITCAITLITAGGQIKLSFTNPAMLLDPEAVKKSMPRRLGENLMTGDDIHPLAIQLEPAPRSSSPARYDALDWNTPVTHRYSTEH